MKKDESEKDSLREHYDLEKLPVRRLGPGRKSFGEYVRLEPDVAAAFPSSESVNEALRLLIRVSKTGT